MLHYETLGSLVRIGQCFLEIFGGGENYVDLVVLGTWCDAFGNLIFLVCLPI